MNYYEQMLENIENMAAAAVIQIYAAEIPPEDAVTDIVTAITSGVRFALAALNDEEEK